MNVEKLIIDYFDNLGCEVTQNSSIIEEGILDSTEIVNFILYLEEKLGAEIGQEVFEISNFKSIQLLAREISRNLDA